MAKNKSRDRTRSKKIPASEENFELTMADIERTGFIPDRETIEARHPGVLTHPTYKREFLMRAIYRLRLQQYTYNQIAAALRVDYETVHRHIKNLKRVTEQDVGMLTYRGEIGRSLSLFRDMQAQVYRMFEAKGDKQMSDVNRLRAAREVVNFEKDAFNVLKEVGFTKSAKLVPAIAKDGAEIKPIDGLRRLLNSLSEPVKTKDKKSSIAAPETTGFTEDDVRILV